MEILVKWSFRFSLPLLKEVFSYLPGELFAQAPIEQHPGIAVETVTDSSRYFVIRIQDGTGKRSEIWSGMIRKIVHALQ